MYFASGDGANASEEAYVAPFSKLRGIHPVNSTKLDLVFDSTHGSRDSADYFDYVRLTIGNNKHKTVINSINSVLSSKQGAMVIVFDSDNSTFIDTNICIPLV